MTRKHFEHYQGQTQVKHLILTDYFRAWVQILGSRYNHLLYWDGFCGTGTYYDDAGTACDGSAVAALKIADEFIQQTRVFCAFTDAQPAFCAELRTRLTELAPQSRYAVESAEFGEYFDRVISAAGAIDAAFVFVDPCGWKGYPIESIERVMQLPRSEVLINFMFNAINEWLTAPGTDASFKELFGMEDADLAAFRASLITLAPGAREQAILDRYIAELRTRARFVFPFKVRFPGKDRTYFYLIHATNNLKGIQVMKDIMFKASGHSLEYAALGKGDSQLALFDAAPTHEDLSDYLLSHFAGQSETFSGVMERTYQYTPFREPDYRTVLKALEKRGAIKVDRVSSKTKRGLKERDRITFP